MIDLGVNWGLWMTHRAQLHVHSLNEWGETLVSTIVTIPCLTYFGAVHRDVGGNADRPDPVQAESLSWNAIVPSSLSVVPKPNDLLLDVRDMNNSVILQRARVIHTIRYDHYSRGLMFTQLVLSTD